MKPLIDLCHSTDKKVKKAAVACLASSTEVRKELYIDK